MTTAMTTVPEKANGNATTAVAKPHPAQMFRRNVTQMSESILKDWVGEDRAKEAIARVAAAFSASAAAAKDPRDFYDCTPQSVAMCIAVSALTGIMPGVGSTALAYVLPQRPRRDEAPQLQYSLSHRGLNALARRCGQTMVAIPVSMNDQIQSNSDGEVQIIRQDFDNPPVSWDELRGVMVVVKDTANGAILSRNWVPKKLIEKRRAMSRSFTGRNPQYSPWSQWPIEMAMKTSMHYSVGRGWCVIDDTSAQRALTLDVDSDLKEHATPSGPRNVNELAGLIAGEMTATNSQADEPQPSMDDAGEESQVVPDDEPTIRSDEPQDARGEYLCQYGETSPKYVARIKQAIADAQDGATLDQIGEAMQTDYDKFEKAQYEQALNAVEARRKSLLKGKEKGSLIN